MIFPPKLLSHQPILRGLFSLFLVCFSIYSLISKASSPSPKFLIHLRNFSPISVFEISHPIHSPISTDSPSAISISEISHPIHPHPSQPIHPQPSPSLKLHDHPFTLTHSPIHPHPFTDSSSPHPFTLTDHPHPFTLTDSPSPHPFTLTNSPSPISTDSLSPILKVFWVWVKILQKRSFVGVGADCQVGFDQCIRVFVFVFLFSLCKKRGIQLVFVFGF